ncbi:hypothetical protein MMC27_008104 [Xylographa pallens]|nr:hypothetical protein [Xylographa pallens]
MLCHATPNNKDGLRALRKQSTYWVAVDFYFITLRVTNLDDVPDCLQTDFDLRPAPRDPASFDFIEMVQDAAKRLKRAAATREKEHLSYGGNSAQWMKDIKAVRGILPILKQVYKDPNDIDPDCSSSDEGTTVDDSSDSGLSGDDTGGSPPPSDHPGNGAARYSKFPTPKTGLPHAQISPVPPPFQALAPSSQEKGKILEYGP